MKSRTVQTLASALVTSAALLGPPAVLLTGPPNAQAQMEEARRIEVARQLQTSSVSIRVGREGGSGFVVGDERWIITNAHVVQGGRYAPIQVQFGDRTETRAEVIAFEPSMDLAVLRTETRPQVAPLRLADSDAVQVGQNVLAFGAPFGLSGTLTQGIVSARRDFPMSGGGVLRGVIQTDAPINPGNSGGPLVNSAGEVIAVNTAILSRTGGSHGIGFAVPANQVSALLTQTRTRIASGDLGQNVAQHRGDERGRETPTESHRPTSPDAVHLGRVWLGILGADYRAPGLEGIRIQRVIPGGPADAAGLRGAEDRPPALIQQVGGPWSGYVITAVDGRPVRSMQELTTLLNRRNPGERARIRVTTAGGAVRGEAVVRLSAPPPRMRTQPQP